MNILAKLWRGIAKEISAYCLFLLRNIPGALGYFLRYICYKPFFKACGWKVYIPSAVFLKGYKNISVGNGVIFGDFNKIYAESTTGEASIKIGDGVTFNTNVMVNADQNGEILIEDDVMIGPNVVMRASGHKFENSDIPIRQQGHEKGVIVIKKGAWIGANVVLLPNVVVGEGAVVGAGAVVTKDVENFSIVGGVPARKIGQREKV